MDRNRINYFQTTRRNKVLKNTQCIQQRFNQSNKKNKIKKNRKRDYYMRGIEKIIINDYAEIRC